jgi:FkbM family methyltransferase
MNEPHTAHQSIRCAAAAQADGRLEEAFKWLQKARKAGMERKKIAQAFLDHVLTTMEEDAEAHPRSAASPVLEHLSHSAKQVRTRCNILKSTMSPDNPARESILLLDSEIGILHHELSLSLERGQFQTRVMDQEPSPTSLAEQNERWLEGIRSHAVSQLGQDLWVLERTSYKRGGFFVEFGATNGILLSNSYLLETEFGWNGICAEPNPDFFAQLRKNRLCTVSPACIGPVTGEEVEFVLADVFGGMLRDIDKDEHQATRETYRNVGATTRFTTISLHDFLVEHQAPRGIDYLSIDTEGSEHAILETFPFPEWDIRHITVEHNQTPQRQLIRDLLASHGYQCQEAKWDDWYYRG